jgi:rod shape-determining protein MreC
VAVTRRSGRSRFTLLLLVLTSVTLLTLDYRGFEPLERVRSGALSVFAPVKDAVSTAFEPVSDTWHGITGYDELEAENDQLRDQITQLEEALASGERDSETLRRIQGELDLDYVGDTPTAVARVVFGPVSNFDHTIEIDKGSRDGIAEGMPVVSSTGLVGRTVQVSENRSIVQLITDPGFRVGVRLNEAQDVGVARGQGRGRPLLIDQGIASDAEVPDGELVITSGYERALFPANIPVGEVLSSESSPGELQQQLLVEPLAPLDELSFVNVMLVEPPE